MMNQRVLAALAAVGILLVVAVPAWARVPPERAAEVGLEGTRLTPMGAIRAGNDEGTIPPWEGGIAVPPPGYESGGWYVDPYPDDKPLFTITARNYQQYQDKLMPGTIAMLQKYPETFFVTVYPTRRSAALPLWHYEGSVWNARRTRFCDPPLGPNREQRCLDTSTYRPGVPFPIPNDGGEAMYNHSLYFVGHYTWTGYAFNAFADGTYAEQTRNERSLHVQYMTPEEKPKGTFFERRGGAAWCFGQEELAPPRNAGSINGGCNYFESSDFDAYVYIPGQRRVRKAPEIGFYDSPSTGSDGLRTSDSRGMFTTTGDEEWYTFAEPQRKEYFIPYNSYKLAAPGYEMKDIVRAGHINSDLKRYELHRVWVLEGTLKPGFRHLSPRRFGYLDEDSWAGAAAEMYDANGELWRVSESYLLQYYDVPLINYWAEDNSDLINGRHASSAGFFNVGAKRGTGPPTFVKPDPAYFTPAGLRKYGVR
jgi:hypothetical protein